MTLLQVHLASCGLLAILPDAPAQFHIRSPHVAPIPVGPSQDTYNTPKRARNGYHLGHLGDMEGKKCKGVQQQFFDANGPSKKN